MNLRDIAKTHMDINMCMLGARSVGKTTIMTAIFDDSRSSNGLSKSNIALTAKSDTRAELLTKKLALEEVFEEQNYIAEAGIAASAAVHTFNFEMGLLGERSCIDFNVTDYPGEFIYSNTEFVNEQISNSSVVLIAIDSPYLMENNAEYNEERNQVSFIFKYLKENIDVFSNKLILLVPLKCEKYFYENRMDELNICVQNCYSEIISLFKDTKNVAIAITPILTMGGVEFNGFEIKDNRRIAKYTFIKNNPQYTPMFCIQPLYYMMSFVAQQYKEYRSNTGFFGGILQRVYDVIDKNEKLFEEFVKLSKFRIENKYGYSVLSGKHLFYN
ncbi:MAG: hypothetical protein J6Q48_05440 [Bacteroidaceae bacterium]|nr:hypothetical protein [Bacteroidaceae bacterium]